MAKSKKSSNLCSTQSVSSSGQCCKVEALVSMDARGQIVLPKDVRKRAEVSAGDKFAVISFESDGKICCISLVKADAFVSGVKEMLGPMMSEVLRD